ncbi:hypothetical protein ACFL45_10735 [Candidatus Neomarinimicrobiota bacterium]
MTVSPLRMDCEQEGPILDILLAYAGAKGMPQGERSCPGEYGGEVGGEIYDETRDSGGRIFRF